MNELTIESFKKIERKDTLVVMGNGPSLGSIDLHILDGYDTYGLNGAYRLYYKYNYWPKFYSCFDKNWISDPIRKKEIQNMITDQACKTQYFVFLNNIFCCSPKLVNIIPKNYKIVPMEETTWKYRRKAAETEISRLKNITPTEANNLIIDAISKYNLNPNVTYTDLVKWVMGYQVTGNETCIIQDKMIFPDPKSLDEFYYYGGSSALIASQVGTCLGYKKIIFIGVDCTYDKTRAQYVEGVDDDNDPIHNEDTYKGVNEVMGTKLINHDEFISYYNQLIIDEFITLQKNNSSVDFVNCGGIISKLDCFRRGELLNELNN